MTYTSKCWAWLFDNMMVFLKDFFDEKKHDFEENTTDDKKK